MKNAEEHYANMLQFMRDQGAHDNPETLYLGTMLSSDSVEIDGLKLEAEDILIADYLKEGWEIPVTQPYWVGYYSTKESIVRKGSGLKKGDIVAVMKCENNDTYVILCKVVSA